MTVRQAGRTAVTILASFALAACSSSAPGRETSPEIQSAPAQTGLQTAGAQAVTINTGDYYFKPNETTLRPGSVTVTLVNEGPRRHTFYVRDLADSTDLFKSDDRLVAGESQTITFTLPDVGRYKIYCAIPGHADRGEVGWLTVTP